MLRKNRTIRKKGNRHLRMHLTIVMKTSEQQSTLTDIVKLHESFFYYKEEEFNKSKQHQQLAEPLEYSRKQHQQLLNQHQQLFIVKHEQLSLQYIFLQQQQMELLEQHVRLFYGLLLSLAIFIFVAIISISLRLLLHRNCGCI